ncbi:hypothetical protein BYT27DRAFT_7094663 [Phlegmacium glaucopus]|nr:hypothetical protein BYT27DRAFT_7094663 [Phlegmacium glaucopus]
MFGINCSLYFELWMIGVIISAMVYGVVLSLTLSYIPLLLKTSYDISRRMRNFLLEYVTFMVAFSTVYIITIIIALRNSMFGGPLSRFNCDLVPFTLENGIPGVMCTMLASWGADGFMLWRCAILYEGVSQPRRIALITVLVSMGVSAILLCLVAILPFSGYSFLVVAAVAVSLNVVTTTLITLRILYFNRYIQKTVGLERDSPYTTIIIICVESLALIVVFSLIFLILYLRPGGAYVIPMQSLVHVYVISPLLIIYRVARRKSATIRQRPSDNGPVVSTLCFEQQPLASSNNEA